MPCLTDLNVSESATTRPWHVLSQETVFSEFGAAATGLDTVEASQRMERYGPNRLPEASPRSPLMRLLAQFHNLLIYVLLGAALIAGAMGHWVDTIVILGVVLVNAVIGFVQEGKAEDALHAIRNMLSSQTMVLRDGRHVSVPAGELVPGDIVLLQSGDKVPADLRLLRAKGLQIQEAVLTGESVAVEKGTDPVTEDAALGDRLCMVYSGTLVTHGQASGIIVATGAATEIGRISGLVAQVQTLTTPLLRQMVVFSRRLTATVLVLALAMFIFGIFGWASTHGSTLKESRTYAVNTLVAMEVIYLFSVRYLRAPSFKLYQLFSSRAVLIAVAVVVTLQLFFTYVPFMERFFDTRPVDFVHGVEIIALGVALFMILELEKLALRKWRKKHGGSRGSPGRSEAKS